MTADWRETWRKKLVPAAAAMKRIKAGNRVFIGSACGEPQALIRALVESGEHAQDTELLNVLTMGVAPYTELRYAERFRANAFFIGHGLREAVGQCRARAGASKLGVGEDGQQVVGVQGTGETFVLQTAFVGLLLAKEA